MLNFKSPSAILFALTLTSCAPVLKDLPLNNIADLKNGSWEILTKNKSFYEKVTLREKMAKATIMFLNQAEADDFHLKEFCKNDSILEVKFAEDRIKKFKAIIGYFEIIELKLKNFETPNDTDQLLDNINGIWGAILPEPAEKTFSIIVNLMKNTLKAGSEAEVVIGIRELSKTSQKNLKIALNDTKNYLVSNNSHLNTAILKWRACELEKLFFLQEDEKSSRAELSKLFEEYFLANELLKNEMKGINEAVYEKNKQGKYVVSKVTIFDSIANLIDQLSAPKVSAYSMKAALGNINEALKAHSKILEIQKE